MNDVKKNASAIAPEVENGKDVEKEKGKESARGNETENAFVSAREIEKRKDEKDMKQTDDGIEGVIRIIKNHSLIITVFFINL